jgi:hypothetical protein
VVLNEDPSFNYEGRIADRQTEEDFETSNLMNVRIWSEDFIILIYKYSMTRSSLIEWGFSYKEVMEAQDALHFLGKTISIVSLRIP